MAEYNQTESTSRQLAFIFFLQFFGLGAFYPLLTQYLLQNLHFSAEQAGMIMSLSALSALATPWFGAVLADRWVSAHKLFALCQLLSAGSVFLLAVQQDYYAFRAWYCVYCVVSGPAIPLAYAVAFHHLPPEGRSGFAGIRVWATVGWLAVAWLFGYIYLARFGVEAAARLKDAFLLSGACSLVLSLYALQLPSTRLADRSQEISFFPQESWNVLWRPQVILLFIIAFALAFIDRLYYFAAAPYLSSLGFTQTAVLPAMSCGQIMEVAGMLSLPWLIKRYGFRAAVSLGAGACMLRFMLFILSPTVPATLIGLACHGISYAWGFTGAQVLLDHFCDGKSRSGVLFALTLFTGGAASLLGSNIGGLLLPKAEGQYALFWLLPALTAALVLLLAFCFLREPEKDKECEEAAIELSEGGPL